MTLTYCSQCGKTFEARQPKLRYCSNKCQRKHLDKFNTKRAAYFRKYYKTKIKKDEVKMAKRRKTALEAYLRR